MLVHRDLEGNGTEWASFADLRGPAEALWAQAAALAGPYTTVIDWRQRPDAASGGAGSAVLWVRAASGAAVPNATISIGAANLGAPATIATGPSGVAELALPAVAPGPWSIAATGIGLPATTVVRYDALANEQTVVGPGPKTSAAPAADQGAWDVPTTVTVLKVDARTQAPVAGAVIEVRAADGSPVATVTTADHPEPVVLGPGDYTAIEVREPDGYLIDDPSPRPFAVGLLGGQVDLVWADTPAAPVIRTRASAPRATPGQAVHDLLTVSGLPPSLAPFPVVVRYLGPVPPPADGDCATLSAAAFDAAPVIGSATVTVRGNGDVPTPTFAGPHQRGCTTFDAVSSAPLWPGGPLLHSPANDADESIEVVSVELSTAISPAVVQPGGAVRDSITIAGLPAWAGTRTLQVALIGPVDAPRGGDCADLPAGAFAGAAALSTATLEVGGDGVVRSPDLPAPARDGQCVTIEIADSAPLWPGGPTIGSPRGLPSETALVRTSPAAATSPSAPGPPSSEAPAAPAAANPVAPAAAPVGPRLANTGPIDARTLGAAAAALIGGGAGLLLLVPGGAGSAAGPGRPAPAMRARHRAIRA